MSTWWRVIAGIGAGVGNLYANGATFKQIGLSLLLALMGVVSHASSTSDTSTANGVKSK